MPFHARGRDGQVRISMRANDDPYATGHDRVARNFDALAFTGFPVVTAEVSFPADGPAGWFGWIQLIRHLRNGEVIYEKIDGDPRLAPLYLVGYRPTFADAPANPDHRDLQWRADTFLLDVQAQHLSPIAGFSWGYRRYDDDRTDLIDPAPADDHAWARIRTRIVHDFPDWTTEPSR